MPRTLVLEEPAGRPGSVPSARSSRAWYTLTKRKSTSASSFLALWGHWGKGVMKLNPPPPSWEDLSAGGTTQRGGWRAGGVLPQDIPSLIPPSPEQTTVPVPGTGTKPGEVSFEDTPRPGSMSPSWPPHCGEFTGWPRPSHCHALPLLGFPG